MALLAYMSMSSAFLIPVRRLYPSSYVSLSFPLQTFLTQQNRHYPSSYVSLSFPLQTFLTQQNRHYPSSFVHFAAIISKMQVVNGLAHQMFMKLHILYLKRKFTTCYTHLHTNRLYVMQMYQMILTAAGTKVDETKLMCIVPTKKKEQPLTGQSYHLLLLHEIIFSLL